MTQLELFPNLERTATTPVTEDHAKQEAARLLETLLQQGFVNVKEGDVSEEHLKSLIESLRTGK